MIFDPCAPRACRVRPARWPFSAIYLVLEFIDGQDLFDQIMAGTRMRERLGG